jgi:hypothetical protein
MTLAAILGGWTLTSVLGSLALAKWLGHEDGAETLVALSLGLDDD